MSSFSVSKKGSPFSVKVWNAEGSPRQVDESQSALFVRKILVFNSKWLSRFSCVDFQDGSLWFLEGKHRFSIP